MSDFQSATTEEVLIEAPDMEAIDPDDFEEPISAKAVHIIRLLWAHRKAITIIVFLGIAISLVYAITRKNVYTSMVTLMPPGNTSGYSSMISLIGQGGGGAASIGDGLGLESPGELYVAILQSRNVQDGLIGRFGLMQYYGARMLGDARGALMGATKVDEDVKSGVISVSVSDNNPTMAAKLANGYTDELNRVLTEGSTSSAHRERVFLEDRLKSVKQDLDEASQALSQFSAKNKTIDISSQARSMVDSGMRLQGDLMDAKAELASLRTVYSDDNARVKAAEARIDELQRQMISMGGSTSSSKSVGQDKALYPSLTELPSLGNTFAELERREKVDEDLWDALTRQYEAAKVAEVKEIPTAHVLDAAIVPERKSAPRRTIIVIAGTMLSFAFACLAVILIEAWKNLDPQNEAKRLVMDAAAGILNSPIGRVPGLRKVFARVAVA